MSSDVKESGPSLLNRADAAKAASLAPLPTPPPGYGPDCNTLDSPRRISVLPAVEEGDSGPLLKAPPSKAGERGDGPPVRLTADVDMTVRMLSMVERINALTGEC